MIASSISPIPSVISWPVEVLCVCGPQLSLVTLLLPFLLSTDLLICRALLRPAQPDKLPLHPLLGQLTGVILPPGMTSWCEIWA